ncbi:MULTISPECIES: saccharopine dehydrogenase C-terminal domain-containing protein [unclassified Pantoea]|uniref:saccharopine dehydrogenase C-terminal domain-containing protein n=1 Tax=unclassified Pantoea TaxID=2630326 RepID=UPI00301CD7C1
MCFTGKRISIIGAGNMGSVLVKMALEKGAYVTLFDIDRDILNSVAKRQKKYIESGKLTVSSPHERTSISIPAGTDTIIVAISWYEARDLISTLASLDICPVIVLGRPDLDDSLIQKISNIKHPILLGTGLEPGLMESISSHILKKNPQSKTLESYCGGLPVTPKGPFGYTLTFGKRLPIEPRMALKIKHRKLHSIPRFIEVKHEYFPSIGHLEAFDDAMLATSAEHFKDQVDNFSQNTLRWPGFSAASRWCESLGLLSTRKVNIGELNVSIRELTNTLLNTASQTDEIKIKDFVLCKWKHINHSGDEGDLVINVSQNENDISAMAFMTCAFTIIAIQYLFETVHSGIIYPHEEPAIQIGLVFLRSLKKHHFVEFKSSGTLTSVIEEAM